MLDAPPPLWGQHTPGTNRLLKQMDWRRLPRSSSSWGQLLRSSQCPVPPPGVVQPRTPAPAAFSEPMGSTLTSGARLSVTLRPSTFLLMVRIAPGTSSLFRGWQQNTGYNVRDQVFIAEQEYLNE